MEGDAEARAVLEIIRRNGGPGFLKTKSDNFWGNKTLDLMFRYLRYLLGI